MFERYSEPARRVIFFARQCADLTVINTDHLLHGLLIELRGRDDVFQLRRLLPEEATRQDRVRKMRVKRQHLPLTDDLKWVLAYSAREADQLGEPWVDPEHLVLGILGKEDCSAAIKLREAGLELETCRRRVVDTKDSRSRRRESILWRVVSPKSALGIALQIALVLGIILVMFLLRN
jgi:ATP-dependent Clp protease ATP-binding subunit ClpA